jgi:hypothetical protein
MAKLPSKPFKIGPGELRWTFINGEGSLNDLQEPPVYEYKSTIVLPKEEAQPYIDAIKTFWDEYAGPNKKAKSWPWKEQDDGTVTFTFKTRTSFQNKDGSERPVVIRVFRANGQEITDVFHSKEMKAANGSEGILHGTMSIFDRPANKGVTLYLQAVQQGLHTSSDHT